MSESPYLITGCDDGNSEPRLEIHELLERSPRSWSLFIRAYTNIMAPGYEPLAASFREMGFIHGRPYQQWSGDPGHEEDPTGRWGGYCYHASPLFPTWHRVVCLLVEQSLYKEAKKIAEHDGQVAPKERLFWKFAAEELRLPWWDWTSPRIKDDGGLSPLFKDPQVPILLPGGRTELFDNPLCFYNIGVTPSQFEDTPYNPTDGSYGYFKSWIRTYRYPDNSTGSPKPVIEQYELLDQNITVDDPDPKKSNLASWQQLSQKVSQLFSFPLPGPPTSFTISDTYWSNVWDVFSNTGQQSGGAPETLPFTLEDPHNCVHNDLGGYGHMGDPDYAGLDPIFFLHHCNVDRILAYWEYVYADYWVRDGNTNINHGYYDNTTKQFKQFVDRWGTYTEPAKTPIDEDSSLTPFRNKEGKYWTSRNLRFFYQDKHSAPKYYHYPPLSLPNGSRLNLQDKPDPNRISALIQGLRDHFSVEPSAATAVKTQPLHARFFQPRQWAGNMPPTHKSLEDFRQFFIVVELVEHAFKGSYSLQVFEKSLPLAKIGSVAVFARRDPAACEACVGRAQEGRKIHGAVLIPHRIVFDLLTNATFNSHSASDGEITRLLASSFGARLVTSGRDPIAETMDEANFGTQLADDLAPNVKLVSAAVAVAAKEGDAHHEFFHDFQSHGPLSHTGWRRTRS